MSYEPYYSGGWKSAEDGGTPITPDALNHMDKGIKGALSADKIIVIHGALVSFNEGVGFYMNSSIVAGAVAFVQSCSATRDDIVGTVSAVFVLNGGIQILLDRSVTVQSVPMNIFLFQQ